MDALVKLSERLNKVSEEKFANPYTSIEWPKEISSDEWYYTPELLSLYGTEVYNVLSEEQKQKLSMYEAVNFFSLNIHGEKDLIAQLSNRLYKNYPHQVTDYIHHFLDEENKHMLWFGSFCMRYAGKVYPNRKLNFPREYAPGEEELLFFIKVLIFEEYVDYFNINIAKDERVHPLARQIHKQHHVEESRHLSFGREMVKTILNDYREQWDQSIIDGIKSYIESYMISTWKEYYNPSMYQDAGLENPYDLVEVAWNSEHSRKIRSEVSEKCIKFLRKNELITGDLQL